MSAYHPPGLEEAETAKVAAAERHRATVSAVAETEQRHQTALARRESMTADLATQAADGRPISPAVAFRKIEEEIRATELDLTIYRAAEVQALTAMRTTERERNDLVSSEIESRISEAEEAFQVQVGAVARAERERERLWQAWQALIRWRGASNLHAAALNDVEVF